MAVVLTTKAQNSNPRSGSGSIGDSGLGFRKGKRFNWEGSAAQGLGSHLKDSNIQAGSRGQSSRDADEEPLGSSFGHLLVNPVKSRENPRRIII